MGWNDEYRVWNSSFPFLCQESLILPHDSKIAMWLPDVTMVTSDSFYQLSKSEMYPLKIHSNGDVDFSPGGFIRFQCKMDLLVFPFDSMKCSARIESWFYPNERQIFNKEKTNIYLLNFSNHEQWELKHYDFAFDDVFYEVSGYTYGTINFNVVLNRKSTYYLVNVIIPSIALSTLEIATFLLPKTELVRIQMSLLILLAFTLLVPAIQCDLPKSSDQVPLLSVYVILLMVYLSLAISGQCLATLISHKYKIGEPVPQWIQRLFSFGKNKVTEIPKSIENDKNYDVKFWYDLANSVDKITKISYCVLLLLTYCFLILVFPLLYLYGDDEEK